MGVPLESVLTCGTQVRVCVVRGRARRTAKRSHGSGYSRRMATTTMQHRADAEEIYAHSPLQPSTVVGRHAVSLASRLLRDEGDGRTALRRLLQPHISAHIPWCGHYNAVQRVCVCVWVCVREAEPVPLGPSQRRGFPLAAAPERHTACTHMEPNVDCEVYRRTL